MAVPKTDAALAPYSTNFNARISGAPGDFSLSVAQAAKYTVLYNTWIAAYNACAPKGSKCEVLVAGKEAAKAQLLDYTRELYGIIRSSSAVSVEKKAAVGVKVDTTIAARTEPPVEAPMLSLLFVTGRTAQYMLTDAAAPTTKRRPANAFGATVMSYVGADPPPPGGRGWHLELQTGKTIFNIIFPNSVEPGTPCWVCARWYNRRGEFSATSQPVQTYLQVGPVAQPA